MRKISNPDKLRFVDLLVLTVLAQHTYLADGLDNTPGPENRKHQEEDTGTQLRNRKFSIGGVVMEA